MPGKPRGRSFAPGNCANPNGRPPFPEEDRKKGRVVLRTTEDEWAALNERAKAAGLSAHSYIRSILFGDAAPEDGDSE